MAAYDFKKKEDIEQFLKNLFTEYNFGCLSEKNPEACHLLGEYYEVIAKNLEKSTELYKNNCDTFDFGRSCYKYARQCVTGSKYCPKDMKKAYQYMRKGCLLNDGGACLYTGMMIVSTDDIGVEKSEVIKEGLEMMKRACFDLKEVKACSTLGTYYLNGVSNFIEKDLKQAYKLLEKGCDSQDMSSCFTLSQMLIRGIGCEKNEKLAYEFRKKAQEIQEDMRKNQEMQFQQGIKM